MDSVLRLRILRKSLGSHAGGGERLSTGECGKTGRIALFEGGNFEFGGSRFFAEGRKYRKEVEFVYKA